MEFKRVVTACLAFSVVFLQGAFANVFAIEEKAMEQKLTNKQDYVNLEFWGAYNDDNLNRFIIMALESNHDLKIAAKNAEIYEQYVKLNRASQLPSVGAGFAPGYSKMPLVSDFDWRFTVPVYVNYEADIFLKNKDKTLSAKKDYEISLLDEKSAYISIASMVGVVYLNILKLDKTISLQEEIVDLRRQIYDIMQLSNKEGITSVQDVIRANKSYVAGNSDLVNLKKQKLQMINTLMVLVGSNPDDVRDFEYSDIENLQFTKNIPDSVESSAITVRPDYLKAESTVEKTGINVRVAKKEFLPSINITGLALFSASEFGSIFTTKDALSSIAASLLADLFTGGKKAANLKAKKAEYEIALQNYEKTNLTAIQEINDALVAIKHDREKYNENKKQNELEKQDYALRELRYKEGVISKLELIQAKENLLSTKKLVLLDKADCFIDYIGLYKALGAKI